MSRISFRALGEIAAVISVVLSLIFVGLQFRQSATASRAAAYQELGIATANVWFTTANNRELSDIMLKVETMERAEFLSLSQSDRQIAVRQEVGVLRLYETVYLQVEQGLLEPDALQSLGWEGFGNSNILKVTWPEARSFVDSTFADYLENLEALVY